MNLAFFNLQGAKQRGKRDYKALWDKTDNPFPRNTSQHDKWNDGWEEARREHEAFIAKNRG